MDNSSGCKNCGYTLEKDQKYCARCGQKVEGKVTLSSIFKNTISNYLSIDSKLLKTIPVFVFRPGKIARQFCDGKRIAYLHPGQLYLFWSVLFFFAFSLHSKNWEDINFEKAKLNFTHAQDSALIDKVDSLAVFRNDPIAELNVDSLKEKELFMWRGMALKIDSMIALGNTNDEIIFHYNEAPGPIGLFIFNQFLDMYRANGNGVVSTVFSQLPPAIFLSLPFYTLLLLLTHIRHKKSFSEHLILTLYLFSFLFLLLAILLLLVWITGMDGIWSWFFIVPPIYFLISLKYFYQQSWWKSVIKLFMVSFAFSLIVIPLAFLLTIFLTILFYGQ